ncbi:MAG TPA: amidase [Candidatus Acidoferrum sp.]|jgi:amidase|nr:amidase [Candidatus Acidoferrum sp.]
MRDIIGAPAAWLARAIRTKQVSSLEVVRAHLEHIHTVNPRLNAVVFATGESALKQARAADRKNSKRKPEIGPLHGVPFTAKDIFDTAGLPTTAGLRMLRSNIPDRDATVVARMRAAGAILIGKTLCPPGGVGGDSWNSLHGGTRNPYDIARSPGASSSGEAAIIAAGGSPLGLGSDSGGSIRMPAHYCGIAALKPTTGLVPSTGAYALPGGLSDPRSQVGPMARFVADLILTLPVLVGPDGIDSGVVPVPLAKRTPKLKGLRVAWYGDDGIAKPTQAISAAVRAAARALGDAGCAVTEARPPALHEAHQVTLGYWGDKRMSHDHLYQRWDAFRTEMLGFMSGFDLIVSPVAPDIAPLYRAKVVPPSTFSYTSPFSLSGNPCVVVRAGTSHEGLPIGVQVVGRNWQDDVALRAARAIERALGGWRPASVVG